jgi:hypothetical protein
LFSVIRFYCKSRLIGHDESNLNATLIWLRAFAGQCYVTDRPSIWRLEMCQRPDILRQGILRKIRIQEVATQQAPPSESWLEKLRHSWKKTLSSIACNL